MITSVDVVTRTLPLKQPQAMGDGTAAGSQDSVFVRVTNTAGVTGVGEASAWPLFGDHSARGHHAALVDLLGPLLLGQDEREWRGLEARMHSRVRGCRVAKAAVETAVLDMMARDRDEPLHRFFGGRGDFRLSLSYSVSLQDVEAEAEMAAELYRSGYRAFKLKTGVLRPEEDVERLVALRERCPEARLRLDYNECASEEALRAILGPAHEVGVEYCEQPFPTGQDARLGRLRSWFDLPLSLDESIATTQDLLRAAEQGLCEYVSLKCGKVGGPVRMLRMAELAVELGLRPYVGSLSETRLGVSAVMAAMSAAEGLAFGSDFYFPYLIVDDSSISGGPRTGSGWLRLPTASGHGCLVPDEWWEDPSADHLAL